MTGFFILIFFIMKIFKKNLFDVYLRQVIVASIVTLYAIHPTITRLTTSLFFCMELDQGETWL